MASRPSKPAAKPGYKTSEFWLSVFAVALPQVTPILAPVLATAGPNTQIGIAIAGAIAAAAYSVSRGTVKKASDAE